ncbi:GGDEF domain-containing protein [Shewanella sp. 1CM18E]|uniref:sensor domain-containing diguanylate cyclase n=1 Tax=Shewanella sp. 1CM18E TaxID=2929169 RepID=UPI0020BD9142|nr:sensor domain-containing diguanylate cyclase [Shewanella sp. 1CM18E]MCK8045306.1 GGDEF domain-containing protein [Shewanella sp. 1CM18E]
MTNIEEALALLAAPYTDERFFIRALSALTLVTQCRWAGFARPSERPGFGEVIAFCDGKKSLPSFEFELKGSPCEQVYWQTEKCHLIFSHDLQNRFPDFPLLKSLDAHSYQAEKIVNNNGNVLGHIFVLDQLPQTENTKSKEFFRLLAQRIGVEYHRHILTQELIQHQEMITSSEQYMSFVDTHYIYRVVSKGYESLFNLPQEQIIGKAVTELHGQPVFEGQIKPLLDRCFLGEQIKTQVWIHPPHIEQPIFLDVHHNPYYDANGKIKGAIVSAHNITELENAKSKVEFLANHDSLTGLANRRSLFQQFEQLLAVENDSPNKVAIAYIDIDDFKSINDNFGHQIGDLVLKEVARLLTSICAQHDTVARIGGDEFVLITTFTCAQTGPSGQSLIHRLREQLQQALCTSLIVEGKRINVSASIGLHLVTDTSAEISALISHADNEMFKYKQSNCAQR